MDPKTHRPTFAAVDTPPPPALDSDTLAVALLDAWSIEVDGLTYLPKGVGSYHWRAGSHFVTVDDLDTKPWIGHSRDSMFTGLLAAYETARRLHDDGLALVVAPVPAHDGSVAVRLEEQYSIAMFPFVDGRAGEWGESITSDERVRLLRGLAELHATTPGAGLPIARRAHVLPERDVLVTALADLHRPWSGGDLAEQTRAALSEHA